MNNSALLAAWVRQQKELGMPDPVVEHGNALLESLRAPAGRVPIVAPVRAGSAPASLPQRPARAAPSTSAADPFSRLKALPTLAKGAAPVRPAPLPPVNDGPLSYDRKREIFTELFTAKCSKCHLAQTRKKFVFGAGNVDARLMIIGEAPGGEEDMQGLPFVGPAGKLLSEMLAAVSIDRKTEVFITNILKCRPPGNRSPESAEILACLPLLKRQIEVVRPAILLLLGRIAAHSLLEISDSILKMRGRTHIYEGVPAVVTYHPAAILRSPEYRAPADEDFQKIAAMLKESKHNGAS